MLRILFLSAALVGSAAIAHAQDCDGAGTASARLPDGTPISYCNQSGLGLGPQQDCNGLPTESAALANGTAIYYCRNENEEVAFGGMDSSVGAVGAAAVLVLLLTGGGSSSTSTATPESE